MSILFKRYCKKYFKEKSNERLKKWSLGVGIGTAIFNVVLVFFIMRFSCQSVNINENIKHISNEMSKIQYSYSVKPLLFIRDIELKLNVTKSNNEFNIDSGKVKYTVINASNISALRTCGLKPVIWTDSIFFIDTLISDTPATYWTMYPQERKKMTGDITLYKEGRFTKQDPIYVHFYYEYWSVLDSLHTSYIIYRAPWRIDSSWFIIENKQEIKSRFK